MDTLASINLTTTLLYGLFNGLGLIVFCHNFISHDATYDGIFRGSHRSCMRPRFQFDFCPHHIRKTPRPFVPWKCHRYILDILRMNQFVVRAHIVFN